MKDRSPPHESPAARDLLARATWADLDRIAARYGVALPGRRRDPAVERLAPIFDHGDRLRAAAGLLSDSGRAVLRLMLLLGAADDEAEVLAARDRLLRVRPDAALERAHIASELATLQSLGLVFAERRRLIVSREVMRALPADPAAPSPPPVDSPRSYAALRATVERLMQQIADEPPPGIALLPPAERLSAYRPRLLPPEAADALAVQLDITAHGVGLLFSLLESLDAIALARGRWQVREGWPALHAQPPRRFMRALLDAWLQPRAWSDLAVSDPWAWVCAPGVACGTDVALHESRLRALVWRWLGAVSHESFDVESLIATLAAIHPDVIAPVGTDLWIARDTPRTRATAAAPESVAPVIVRALLDQLRALGLVAHDGSAAALTPLSRWLVAESLPPVDESPIRSDGADALLVDPLRADPATLEVIQMAGRIDGVVGERLRYRLTAGGIGRLLEQDIAIDDLRRALADSGAAIEPAFADQLDSWGTHAGRLRLHHPLSVLLTPEDAPLSQILRAAGLDDAAEIIGSGCAVIEPERVAAAVEELRARGFWPIVSGHEVKG